MTAAASVDQLLEPYGVEDEPTPLGAEYVAAPRSLDEAAKILRIASDHGLQTLLRGAGTHHGLGYPTSPDLVVSTARLNSVVAYEPEDLTIVVEAGMRLDALDAVLAERGQTAVLPEQTGGSTVGGVIAAGVSGWRRLGYGPIRDRMLEVQLVTGDGRVVTGGGRVVKNVSGYDLPRLVTGSLGSLGLVGAVCLKLWPQATHTASIAVAEADAARRQAYRPLAIIETNRGSTVYVSGTEQEIAGQAADMSGTASSGLHWPDPLDDAYQFSLRVPASLVVEAVRRVRELGGDIRFQAAHGVGEVKLGGDDVDLQRLIRLRGWAETVTGSLVMTTAPEPTYEIFDPWGQPPATLELQRRVKRAFDPAGIVNTGRLPGRL